MNTYRAVFRPLIWCLLYFALPEHEVLADDNELLFQIKTTPSKPVETVRLTPHNDNPIECSFSEKTTAKGVKTYSCKLPQIREIETYDLSVEGDALDIQIAGIRVYPTMKKPTVIILDLTDDVFSKGFATTPDYYKKWNSIRVNRELAPYLITRNYFLKTQTEVSPNSGNANILKKWLEQAMNTAENLSYQPIDQDAMEYWRKFKENREVFDKLFSKPTELQKEVDRLEIADWSILKQGLSASDSDIGKRREDFCHLWQVFADKWKATNDDTKNSISITYGINSKMMTDHTNKNGTKTCDAPP